MKNIEFIRNGEVHQEVRNLCLRGEKTKDANYYTLSIKNAIVFVIDREKSKLSYKEAEKQYKKWLENETLLRTIVKNMPYFDVYFDDVEYSLGIERQYFEGEIEKEFDTYNIVFDLYASESYGYEEETNGINVHSAEIQVSDPRIIVEDGQLDLTEKQTEKLTESITKNIRLS